jgi:hypothetical protein
VNQNYYELIAFLVRETGWTLEYIKDLPLADLSRLAEELAYQKQLDDYRMQASFASVIVTMINLWSKDKRKVGDLVGQPPKRRNQTKKENDIWKLAQATGIKVPADRS